MNEFVKLGFRTRIKLGTMMADRRLRDIFEVVGLSAVVASLIFVGIQLRQDQTIARSELGSGSFDHMAMISQTITDHEFAEVYAKMLDHPEDLSTAEKLQVNGFLNQVANFVQRECYLVSTTVFVECDAAINEYLPKYFGNRYAISWWNSFKPNIQGQYGDHNGWVARVDAQIRNLDPSSEARILQEIETGL